MAFRRSGVRPPSAPFFIGATTYFTLYGFLVKPVSMLRLFSSTFA